MAGQKNRTQLQALFKTGAKPSEDDFRDLIDSVLNIHDDGIEKPPGVDTPLKILARGETENLLDFYADDIQTWRLNQQPAGANPGLNFETGGISKLFVESSSGNLGLSITQPTAKLHIQQSGSQDALRIDDEANDTTPLLIDAAGNVGIGKAQPDKTLDVNGDAAIAGTLSVTQTSTLTGNVGIGTAADDELKLNVAGNSAIAGTLSVTQTSTLSGNVGIGTTPGTERLKVSGDLAVSQASTLAGNVGIGIAANTDHKLTIYGGELALKTNDNESAQSILFQNSGGAYTWRIYRENIGNNKADLKIAGGTNGDFAALTDYVRIQESGHATFSKNLTVSGTASFTGNVDLSSKLTIPGGQQLIFANGDTSNNLKLRLWDGYGLGINSSTLFYAANGKHSWRDANGANERMLLTTAASGGLTVKGTGDSSFAGKLGIGTDDPSEKLTVKDGDIKIEGGRYRRLKIVSDKYWAGIELVAREQGEAGNPHIDFTHGDLDSPNYGIRLYAPDNNSLLIDGGTLGFVSNGDKPLQLKKFTGNDNPRINTGYSTADWVVIIAGFSVSSDDKAKGQYVYTYVNSG
ncbi:MAG: hypothetical protein F6K04_07690, partial [Leptolyngbya sp. SIO4C5]|nr:hypothetical protein [Leptolyngbya sp. SIO4C5]